MLTVQRLEIFNINTNDPMQQLFDSKFPAVFHCQKVTDHSPCLPHFLLLNAESKSSSRTDEIHHYDYHVKFENNTSGRARLWDTALKCLCPGLSITSPDHLAKISCHVHENNHIIDFGSVKVVGHEANYHERLFLEAWFSIRDPQSGNDHIAIPEVYKWHTHKSRATFFQEPARRYFFLSARLACCYLNHAC